MSKKAGIKTITVSEVRSELSDTINEVAFGKSRVMIERNGKPTAVMVPVEDLEILEAFEDQMDIEAARKALKTKGTIPWKKVKAELGL